MNDKQQWGMTACGSSGGTSVNVDESCSGDLLYELEISKPTWLIRCRIDSPEVIRDFLSFLTSSDDTVLTLGTLAKSVVEVRRDDEFDDRFFIVAGGNAGILHCTIAGSEEVQELTDALKQTIKDL